MAEDDDNEIFMRLNKLYKELGYIPDDAEEDEEVTAHIKGKIKVTQDKIKVNITIKTDD